MTHMKKKNGVDIMKVRKSKQKRKKYRSLIKVIEGNISEKIHQDEAKILLHILIYHFDGFTRQQQIINTYMSLKYHWGNKRTSRVLKTLAAIDVIDRWKSESDNWTLFFLVKGFIEECRNKIYLASFNIKERLKRYYSAILAITRIRKMALEPE